VPVESHEILKHERVRVYRVKTDAARGTGARDELVFQLAAQEGRDGKKNGPRKSLTLLCPLQVASFLGPLSSGSGRVQFDAELLRKITTLFQLLSKQQKRNKEGQ
jgi:hypothetical protein